MGHVGFGQRGRLESRIPQSLYRNRDVFIVNPDEGKGLLDNRVAYIDFCFPQARDGITQLHASFVAWAGNDRDRSHIGSKL